MAAQRAQELSCTRAECKGGGVCGGSHAGGEQWRGRGKGRGPGIGLAGSSGLLVQHEGEDVFNKNKENGGSWGDDDGNPHRLICRIA